MNLMELVPQTYGEAVQKWRLVRQLLQPHEWDNSTTVENAIWLIRQMYDQVVFTNGCFDLIHPGHVHLLRECVLRRVFKSCVVVGMNTDESVRLNKGPLRPLVCYDDREVVLGALRGVDWVLPFNEKTPENLIRMLRPEVLVKGAEYEEKDIVGADLVRGWGGEVVRVEMRPGKSTSSLIERLRGV